MPGSIVLLIHKMLGHGIIFMSFAGILAVDFRDQITLSGVITTSVIIVIAGIFTIRSKIASGWHDAYEVEKTQKEQVQKELSEEKASRIVFDKDQQEIRHSLKNDIGILQAQLIIERNKTDLTAALQAVTDLSSAQQENFDKLHSVLTDIRDGLTEDRTIDGNVSTS